MRCCASIPAEVLHTSGRCWACPSAKLSGSRNMPCHVPCRSRRPAGEKCAAHLRVQASPRRNLLCCNQAGTEANEMAARKVSTIHHPIFAHHQITRLPRLSQLPNTQHSTPHREQPLHLTPTPTRPHDPSACTPNNPSQHAPRNSHASEPHAHRTAPRAAARDSNAAGNAHSSAVGPAPLPPAPPLLSSPAFAPSTAPQTCAVCPSKIPPRAQRHPRRWTSAPPPSPSPGPHSRSGCPVQHTRTVRVRVGHRSLHTSPQGAVQHTVCCIGCNILASATTTTSTTSQRQLCTHRGYPP